MVGGVSEGIDEKKWCTINIEKRKEEAVSSSTINDILTHLLTRSPSYRSIQAVLYIDGMGQIFAPPPRTNFQINK